MINQFSPNGGFSLLEKQHNYVSQWSNDPSIDKGSLDFRKSVEAVTTRDKPRSSKLNDKIFSSQEWTLLVGSMPIYDSNQQSIRVSKEINERQKMKKVFINGEFPKEIKRNNYEKIINDINQNFVLDWQKINELEDKDIDISLSFESDPESSDLEMIYTIYVMDLNKNDVEIVWNKLRKLFNGIIDNMKHSQPRYRRKVEKLERLAVIHIEW
jgi:hypothetical protein